MNAAIIAAGGTGERFGAAGGKQLALICGEPLLLHTLRSFEAAASIDTVIVVTHPDRVEQYAAALGTEFAKVAAVVAGGRTRRESVAAGLQALPQGTELVAVHDGARAAVTPLVIDGAVAALSADRTLDGVVVGHPAYDTIKRVSTDGVVSGTPDRAELWVAQTPQVFRVASLAAAHKSAEEAGFEGTDDASLIERDGGRVLMVPGPRWNLKVTVPEDLTVLEALIEARGAEQE